MDVIDSLFTEYRHLISLINGLAFFTLGVSISLESNRGNKPKLSGPLPMLAGYGFMAALANWLRMFMLIELHPEPLSTNVLQVTRLSSLVFAGVFLLRYGTEMISHLNMRFRWVRSIFIVSCVVYIISLGSFFFRQLTIESDWVSTADTYARLILLFPAFILVFVGFWMEHLKSANQGQELISSVCLGGAIAFGLKAFTSGLIAFPVFGHPLILPVPLTLALSSSRTLSSIAVAYFVIRILKAFEDERSRQFVTAMDQRFEAQQDILATQQQLHSEVEQWSRQLEDLVDSIASAMSQVTSLKDILDVSLSKVLELTKFDAGDILLVQESGSELQLITQKGLSQEVQECRTGLALGTNALGDISASDEFIVIWNLVEDPKLGLRLGTKTLKDIQASGTTVFVWNLYEDSKLAGSPCLKAGFRCLVNVLVTCRGNILGIMNLLGKSDCVPQPNELRVLSAIGQQIGVAIENARLSEQAQSIAALQERERLGRELHDGLAQVLGYLYIKSYNANSLIKAGQIQAAQEELDEMQEVAGDTQRDVREAILGLRTTITPETGIITTLTEYVRRFSQQSGINTILVTTDELALEFDPIVEIQLLRIVQEALTNTRKHSLAPQAWVRVEKIDQHAVITIEDNGKGFDLDRISKEGHYGVHTMKERAQSVEGEAQILSEPGNGTKIVVQLPLKHWRVG